LQEDDQLVDPFLDNDQLVDPFLDNDQLVDPFLDDVLADVPQRLRDLHILADEAGPTRCQILQKKNGWNI
jgi:hypothetical protein